MRKRSFKIHLGTFHVLFGFRKDILNLRRQRRTH
jgi:hypothetical protein